MFYLGSLSVVSKIRHAYIFPFTIDGKTPLLTVDFTGSFSYFNRILQVGK